MVEKFQQLLNVLLSKYQKANSLRRVYFIQALSMISNGLKTQLKWADS